jgi:phage baseplate assembly protein W
MELNELTGIGWEFPPKFDKIGSTPLMISGEEGVANSIYVILHTKLGERIMRTEFGSTLHELLFESLTANMKTFMSSSLKKALTINEPRIQVQEILLEQNDLALGRVDIRISYTFIETNQLNNLVLPFYTPDNLNS